MVVGGLGRSRWWPKTLVTQSRVIDVKSGEGSCEGSLFCFGGWLILMFCLRSECCCCFRFLWDLRCCNFGGGGQLREQLFFCVGKWGSSHLIVMDDCCLGWGQQWWWFVCVLIGCVELVSGWFVLGFGLFWFELVCWCWLQIEWRIDGWTVSWQLLLIEEWPRHVIPESAE